jgi:hypothetical protein
MQKKLNGQANKWDLPLQDKELAQKVNQQTNILWK